MGTMHNGFSFPCFQDLLAKTEDKAIQGVMLTET